MRFSIPKSTSVDGTVDTNAEVDPYCQVIVQDIPDPLQSRRSKVFSEQFDLEPDSKFRFASPIATSRR